MMARLEQALGSKFQMSADQADAAFRAQVVAKLSEAEPTETGTNDTLKDINAFVRTEIGAMTDALRTLETWLHLSVPQVSDGNNFGVEVVEYAAKRITDAKTATKAQLDEVKKYSQDRAGAWEKAVFPQSKKKSSSQETKKTSGGEKDENTTSASESVNTSINMVVTDAVEFIIAVDTTHYLAMRANVLELLKTCTITADLIQKNLARIQDPRGDKEASGMSMF